MPRNAPINDAAGPPPTSFPRKRESIAEAAPVAAEPQGHAMPSFRRHPGARRDPVASALDWIPACAGMTPGGRMMRYGLMTPRLNRDSRLRGNDALSGPVSAAIGEARTTPS